MAYRAIRTSRLAILEYYLVAAALPDAELAEWTVGRLRSPDVMGHDEGDFVYETFRETVPSLTQAIGRKLDRKVPRCFACGTQFDDWRRELERAHIVAASANGADIAANYVLLCSNCHLDAPMTNRVDWMLEWVDRGPAAAGWRSAGSLYAAVEAETIALLNYKSFGAAFSDSAEFFGIRIVGADTSLESVHLTYGLLADEVEADLHFGQTHFSPATRAYLYVECWARVNASRSSLR